MSHDVAGSSESQDEAALALIGHSGYFLDLGSAHPILGNNTICLEKAGWHGMLFDVNPWAIKEALKCRKARAVEIDLSVESVEPFLVANHAPFLIDYISFDVDAATVSAVEKFPFERYAFKFMTFEHDLYCGNRAKKGAMIDRLSAFPQYEVLAENVEFKDPNGHRHAWEDWWVNTEYFPSSLVDRLHTSGALHEEVLERIKAR
jgi:hypothetical protein